jgi:hypothetical protein
MISCTTMMQHAPIAGIEAQSAQHTGEPLLARLPLADAGQMLAEMLEMVVQMLEQMLAQMLEPLRC